MIAVQLLALLVLQLNMIAPQLALLFPAEAADGMGECHCPPESCRNGTCCCNHNKKKPSENRSPGAKEQQGETSLRACPCGASPHFTLVSSEDPVYIGASAAAPSRCHLAVLALVAGEYRSPLDHIPNPPEPPPRLPLIV